MGAFMRRLNNYAGINPAPPSIQTVSAEYLNRRQLLESTRLDGNRVCLWVPCREAVLKGASIICHLRIQGEIDDFFVRGTVLRSDSQFGATRHPAVEIEATGEGRVAFSRLYAKARGVPAHRGTRSEDRVPVRLSAVMERSAAEEVVQVEDLSMRGLRIRCEVRAPHVGDTVAVSIRIGLLTRLNLKGRVVWNTWHAAGIEITDLAPVGRQLLGRLLASNAPRLLSVL